uniref:Uncharacterized protein LOC104248230 n=1 Tax=Nicotiana sylvestris TaxID=4096 RepID=A0A1U7YF69_NICSY|nr:PREDICTED: uncharacterized protein LOC104248230 [Nicotiana sylvestris]
MTNLKKQESDMSTYLEQVQAVMEKFEKLTPVSASDRNTEQTIGTRRESQRLYYLNSLNPSIACPDLIHRCLGHPSLSKLQKMVPRLPMLDCNAVITAGYLINRMPSSSIQNQIPHSVLFPKSPLYSLPPRVFGSTCFVHNLAPGKDKFAPRALKRVFLDYSRVQKGYRCYSPDLRRYLMSANVTFFES